MKHNATIIYLWIVCFAGGLAALRPFTSFYKRERILAALRPFTSFYKRERILASWFERASGRKEKNGHCPFPSFVQRSYVIK